MVLRGILVCWVYLLISQCMTHAVGAGGAYSSSFFFGRYGGWQSWTLSRGPCSFNHVSSCPLGEIHCVHYIGVVPRVQGCVLVGMCV